KDIQLQAQFCPVGEQFPCAGPQNVGSAHIKGFEAELFAEPVDGFTIDGSLSYLDFEYYELLGVPTMTLDMVAPFTPEWSWSFGAQYEIDLGSTGTLTPRLDGSYRSHIFTDPVNGINNTIPSRFLMNARLAW